MPSTERSPTIKDRERISKKQVERALADPNLKPLVESALKVRGLTVDSLFPAGALNAIWSKTYTESTKARITNPVSHKDVMTTNLPPTSSDLSILHKVRERSDEIE